MGPKEKKKNIHLYFNRFLKIALIKMYIFFSMNSVISKEEEKSKDIAPSLLFTFNVVTFCPPFFATHS